MTHYIGSCTGHYLGAHAVVLASSEPEARKLMDAYAANYGVKPGEWEIKEIAVAGNPAMLYFDNGDY